MSWIEIAPAWAAPAAAWMLTYLLHSTVLLALAAAVGFALGERRAALQEVIWKCALIGGLATASLQAGLGWTPLAGSWELPGTAGVVAADGSEPLQREGARRTGSTASGEAAAAGAPGQRLDGAGATRLEMAGRSGGGAAGSHGSDTSAASPRAAAVAGPASAPASAPAAGGRSADAPHDRAAGPSPAIAGAATRSGATLGTAWPLLAVAAWLALALFFTARLAADYLRLATRLRERWPVADGAVAALFGRLLGKSGRRRPVTLTGSERLPVPIAWGLARPEVSLPARVLRDLSPYHQESILAHELAHVLRRDPAWLAAARLLEAVLFFQPLNRLARRRLQEIAEVRCDDRAVELTGRPLELARCLTEVATWRLAGLVALPVPSMASGSSLGRRVRRLVDGKQGEPLPRWVRPAAVAAVLAVALAAPGVTRGKPAPQEPAAAPAAASSLTGAGEAEPGADRQAASESENENDGWVIVGGRSWDELTPAERDEVRRDVAAARRDAAAAGREAREHARQALDHTREQLRHQRHALRGLEGGEHLEGLEGLSGLIGGSVRLGLTAASAALAAVDVPAIQAEIERAMAEAERELAREMPKIEAEVARALAEAERHPKRQAEIAEAMAELEAEMPRIEAEIAAAMAEVERELAREMPKIQAEVAAAMAEVARELAAEMPKITAEVTAAMAEVERELAREMPRIQAEVTAAMAEAERELAREMPRIEAEIDRAMADVERELAAIEAEMESEEDADEVESEEIAPDAPSPR